MESTGHKGIVLGSVAEDDQFGAANTIPICGEKGGLLDLMTHERNSIHIDTGFGRTNVDRAAHVFGDRQSLGNGVNQLQISSGKAFVNKGRVAADKVDADSAGRLLQG